jgi:hypothetical protein
MNYAFEAAVITVTIGAVLSVLLQGGLLDRDSTRHMSPRAILFLRVLDIWLATVFLIVVFILVAVSLGAIGGDAPLKRADRIECLHLLVMASIYPVFIALARRVMPVLFPDPIDPYGTDSVTMAVFLGLCVLGPLGLLVLYPPLTNPHAKVVNLWVDIAAIGSAIAGLCVLWPKIEARWLGIVREYAGRRARALRLVEQTVTVSIPFREEDEPVRVLVGSIERGPVTCWLDSAEARRVVCMLHAARIESRQRLGHDLGEAWTYNGGLIVERSFEPGPRTERWRQVEYFFVDGTELLTSLHARSPLDQRDAVDQVASSLATSAAKPG